MHMYTLCHTCVSISVDQSMVVYLSVCLSLSLSLLYRHVHLRPHTTRRADATPLSPGRVDPRVQCFTVAVLQRAKVCSAGVRPLHHVPHGCGPWCRPGVFLSWCRRGPAAQSLPVATGTHGHLCPSLPKPRFVAWLGRRGLRVQQSVVAWPAQVRRGATSPATLRRRVAAGGQGRLCSSMPKLASCRSCCSSGVASTHTMPELHRVGPACEASLREPAVLADAYKHRAAARPHRQSRLAAVSQQAPRGECISPCPYRGPAAHASSQGGPAKQGASVALKNNIADGHTVSNAPDLFRPPKLSGTGPGQYWGGGPPGKPLGCCQLLPLFSRHCC